MVDFLASYCQFFGYPSCDELSTFEALVLFGIGAFAVVFGLALVMGALDAFSKFWGSR